MNWTIYNETLRAIFKVKNPKHAYELVERCAKLIGAEGLIVFNLLPGTKKAGRNRLVITARGEKVSSILATLNVDLLSPQVRQVFERTAPAIVQDLPQALRGNGLGRLARIAKFTRALNAIAIPVKSKAHGEFCFLFLGKHVSAVELRLSAMTALCHVTVENLLGDKPSPQEIPANGLSSREHECMRLLVLGKSDAEIAVEIGIAERTVRFHIDRAKAKLGVKTRVQAVSRVVAESVID